MDISRSIEVFDPEMVKEDVHIIGVGATGSFVIQTLVRFGVKKIHCYDGDSFENHNINNQCVYTSQLNKPKVLAQKELCEAINPNVEIIAHEKFVTPEDIAEMSGYVFSLVDSMKTRKELWEAIKKNEKIKYYWESRLGKDQGRVYCLPIEKDFDYSTYESPLHMYGDDVAEVSACGTSITIVTIVLGVTSLMINQFIKIVMGKKNEEPYIRNFSLFDNMFNLYSEDFKKQIQTVSVEEAEEEVFF